MGVLLEYEFILPNTSQSYGLFRIGKMVNENM
jgi:hypothetical protein